MVTDMIWNPAIEIHGGAHPDNMSENVTQRL
jgi:hypothetical protein